MCCVRAQSRSTLCDFMDCSLPGSSVHEIFQARNTGVGCPFLLQGIFPTQWFNPHPLHGQADSLPLRPLGSLQRKCLICTHTHIHTYIHTMEYLFIPEIYIFIYYLSPKKKEILPFVTTWINLEDIIISEISQSQKEKCCMIALIWDIKNSQIHKSRTQNVVARIWEEGNSGVGVQMIQSYTRWTSFPWSSCSKT